MVEELDRLGQELDVLQKRSLSLKGVSDTLALRSFFLLFSSRPRAASEDRGVPEPVAAQPLVR